MSAAGDSGDERLEKHLYLFEVLVKNIDIKEKFLNEWERDFIIRNPLKVKIIFSDFFDVEITDVKDCKSIPEPEQVKCHSKMVKIMSNTEATADEGHDNCNDNEDNTGFIQKQKGSEQSRRAGYSCLFPMYPLDMLNKLRTSSLYMMLYGSIGNKDYTKVIGQGKILIKNDLMGAVQYSLATEDFPTTASLGTMCNIKNVFKEKVAKIEIYVRLSCFGKYIISRFNMTKDISPKFKKLKQEIGELKSRSTCERRITQQRMNKEQESVIKTD